MFLGAANWLEVISRQKGQPPARMDGRGRSRHPLHNIIVRDRNWNQTVHGSVHDASDVAFAYDAWPGWGTHDANGVAFAKVLLHSHDASNDGFGWGQDHNLGVRIRFFVGGRV